MGRVQLQDTVCLDLSFRPGHRVEYLLHLKGDLPAAAQADRMGLEPVRNPDLLHLTVERLLEEVKQLFVVLILLFGLLFLLLVLQPEITV